MDRRLPSVRVDKQDLARHDIVGYDGPLQNSTCGTWWTQQGVKRFAFRSNSDHAIEDKAIAQGQGLGLLVKAQARTLSNLLELRYDGVLPTLRCTSCSTRSCATYRGSA